MTFERASLAFETITLNDFYLVNAYAPSPSKMTKRFHAFSLPLTIFNINGWIFLWNTREHAREMKRELVFRVTRWWKSSRPVGFFGEIASSYGFCTLSYGKLFTSVVNLLPGDEIKTLVWLPTRAWKKREKEKARAPLKIAVPVFPWIPV